MAEKIIFAEKPVGDEPWDVAIIGSGPASLTASIYTTRGAASTLILGGEKWGGQLMLTTTVDNFPGFPEGIQGPDLMNAMRKQAERFGGQFMEKNVEKVDFAKEPKEIAAGGVVYKARAVIIATGADTKWLGVPGEDKLRGRGISSCAPCDAPFFKDKKVVVVGGGDAAMEEALVLTKYATKVIMVHRRGEFKASAAMQAKVFDKEKEGKVSVVWDSEVTEMMGEEKLAGILLRTKLDSPQVKELKDGGISNFQGEVVEEKEEFLFWKMPTDGLFVAIGHTPSTEIFRGHVELDEKGYVVAHNHTRTDKENGIFVAGDVHDYTYRQAITAAGFGCMAGMDTLKYLDKGVPNW